MYAILLLIFTITYIILLFAVICVVVMGGIHAMMVRRNVTNVPRFANFLKSLGAVMVNVMETRVWRMFEGMLAKRGGVVRFLDDAKGMQGRIPNVSQVAAGAGVQVGSAVGMAAGTEKRKEV